MNETSIGLLFNNPRKRKKKRNQFDESCRKREREREKDENNFLEQLKKRENEPPYGGIALPFFSFVEENK